MIVVHDIFVCKPGNASKFAKMIKETMAGTPGAENTIMTDVTGQYHRVIMVSKFESLTAYDQAREKMKNPDEATKKSFEKMNGSQEMYLTGSREIYQVW